MHIQNSNILEMVKDKAKMIIAIKYEIIHALLNDLFALDLDSF